MKLVLNPLTGKFDYVSDPQNHDPVVLGSANGLSLSGQELSMALASATSTGSLSAADWTTFNNKLSDAPQNGVTYGRNNGAWVAATGTGGGSSGAEQIGVMVQDEGVPKGTGTTLNFVGDNVEVSISGSVARIFVTGSSHDLVTLGNANGLLLSGQQLSIEQASATKTGTLSPTDWTTFNNKVPATRQILTTSPLAGGGDLSANRTLSMPQASGTTSGYLSGDDWTTFYNKLSDAPKDTNKYARLSGSWSVVSEHNPVTLGNANGLSLSGQQLSTDLASATKTGTLSSADWSTFNNKVGEAPTDGQMYGRRSGSWNAITPQDEIYFSAHLSGTQSIPASTNTAVVLNQELRDSHGYYDPTTGIFTPLTSGTYQFHYTITLQALEDGKALWMGLRKTSGSIVWGNAVNNGVSPTGTTAFGGTTMTENLFLNGSGDYIQAMVWQNGSAAKNAYGLGNGWQYTRFSGRRISDDNLTGL